MTDMERLESKLDRILELAPTIEALGSVLVRRQSVIDRVGINKNTLTNHASFEEIGKRKTLIEISEISTVKKRKGTKKRDR